ncbi:ATP-binding cassette domain-containing protein, partial [Escherichia coli]|uniref:ATP-binding cassette domain-containing protein n=1 Tax=Escherichia coli TaxID=562 RepID=UPI00398B1825
MERTEVTGLVDREVTRLSGGERARVTLARVLAQQEPCVFLDEPTAALSPKARVSSLPAIRMAQTIPTLATVPT